MKEMNEIKILMIALKREKTPETPDTAVFDAVVMADRTDGFSKHEDAIPATPDTIAVDDGDMTRAFVMAPDCSNEKSDPLATAPPYTADWVAAAIDPADTPADPNPTAANNCGAPIITAAVPTAILIPTPTILMSQTKLYWVTAVHFLCLYES